MFRFLVRQRVAFSHTVSIGTAFLFALPSLCRALSTGKADVVPSAHENPSSMCVFAGHDFVGTVRDAATGKPLTGATVSFAYAHPRVGTSPFCPSCWADCAKHQKTDASGAFYIDAPDPSLLFTVLVVCNGYKPTFFFDADPSKGKVTYRLKHAKPDAPHDPQIVHGQVVGPDGKPLVGASISVNGYAQKRDAETFGGLPSGMDPLVITGSDGTFAYHVAPPYRHVLLQIDAPGMTTRLSGWREAGKPPITLKMTPGATVTGHVRGPDGRILSGLKVRWVQENRNCEVFVGSVTIATDRNGDFVLNNLKPQEASFVCVASEGALAAADLAVPLCRLTTPNDGAITSVADLNAVPAATFRGRLKFADGHAVPPNTRVTFGRESGWDSQQAVVTADGTFTFHGVPPGEMMHVVIQIPGYQLDKKTLGLYSYAPELGRVTFTAPTTAGPMPERTFMLNRVNLVKTASSKP